MIRKFLVLALTSIVFQSQAQSVDRNDIVFSITSGPTLNYYGNNDSIASYYVGDYLGFRTPASVEYVFNRTVGVSADFVYSRLVAGSPHPSNYTVLDFGVGIRFHSPSSVRKLHWFGAVGYHYSNLHFRYHGDFLHDNLVAKGGALSFELGVNIALTSNQKFGMGINLNGAGYKYPKANYKDNNGRDVDFKLGGLATSVGLNFYYKL